MFVNNYYGMPQAGCGSGCLGCGCLLAIGAGFLLFSPFLFFLFLKIIF